MDKDRDRAVTQQMLTSIEKAKCCLLTPLVVLLPISETPQVLLEKFSVHFLQILEPSVLILALPLLTGNFKGFLNPSHFQFS